LPKITAIFWDVGGVLLTNAWDRAQRQRALKQFALDEVEFDDRHDMLISSFERGKIGLQEYLERTIFYRPRPFTPKAFTDFMFSLSQPDAETLRLAKELDRSCRYLMATINNESTGSGDETSEGSAVSGANVRRSSVRKDRPEDGH